MMNLPQSVLQASAIFVSIIIEAVPFVLFGCVITGFLQSFLDPAKVKQWIPKNKILAILTGMFLGFFFPSCECGIVPIVKELLKKGVPSYTAITFMLTAPIINPVVLFSTYIAFNNDSYPVFLRVLGSLVVAFIIGLWLAYRNKDTILKEEYKKGETAHAHSGSCCNEEVSPKEKVSLFNKISHALQHSVDEFFDTGRYLVIGALLAALMQTYLKTALLFPYASNKVTSILIMMGFAFILSLCSEADAFIGTSMKSMFGLTPVIGFLVYGPMVDIKNLMMMSHHFTRKFMLKLIGLVTVIVFIYTLLL